MITAGQLVAHAVGDYVLQSDWMALEKTKRHLPALLHALTYGIPFLFLRPSLAAFAVIVGTHFIIDRWRLARYVCWAKNFIAPIRFDSPSAVGFPDAQRRRPLNRIWPREGGYRVALYSHNKPWADCKATGYPDDRPAWMTVWLMIVADNTLHVLINAAALTHL